MKKVSLIVSILALAFSASCTKQKLGQPEVNADDLEVVFEELEENDTKAAVTSIDLDVNGNVYPSSRILTATLRYKTSKTPITNGVSWSWDKSFTGVEYDGNAHRATDNQQKLDAVNIGSGTISTVATYKGQEVSSPTVDVNVSEYELRRIEVKGYNRLVAVEGESGYTMRDDEYYAVDVSGSIQDNVYAYFSVKGEFHKKGTDDNEWIRLTPEDGVSYTFPGMDDVTLFTGSEHQVEGKEAFKIPLKKGMYSNTLGKKKVVAEYKDKKAELEFAIVSDPRFGHCFVDEYYPYNPAQSIIGNHYSMDLQVYPSDRPNYIGNRDYGTWHHKNAYGEFLDYGVTLPLGVNIGDSFAIAPDPSVVLNWTTPDFYNNIVKSGLLNLIIRSEDSSYFEPLDSEYEPLDSEYVESAKGYKYFFFGDLPATGEYKYILEMYFYNQLVWTMNLFINKRQ